jgi:hypothetical protein
MALLFQAAASRKFVIGECDHQHAGCVRSPEAAASPRIDFVLLCWCPRAQWLVHFMVVSLVVIARSRLRLIGASS